MILKYIGGNYETKEIVLNNGEICFVDDEDYEYLSKWSWRPNKGGYARASIWNKEKKKYNIALMHRLIMDAPEGIQVDHINHNKLDNRKENLRLCNNAENQWNQYIREGYSSIYKGVTIRKCGSAEANITINEKKLYLGRFSREEAAASCYNYWAERLFGKFALLNEIHLDNWKDYQNLKENSSEYKGVHWSRKVKKWVAKIFIEKEIYLGRFETELEAAYVYNQYIKDKDLDQDKFKLNDLPDGIEIAPIRNKDTTKSKFFGVQWDSRRDKWLALVYHNKKRYHAGYFDNEVEAAIAYNKKASEIKGSKAKLNKINKIKLNKKEDVNESEIA